MDLCRKYVKRPDGQIQIFLDDDDGLEDAISELIDN